MGEYELTELWKTIEYKFNIDLKNDFSNKNVEGWLSHFIPNKKIYISQFGKDATGKRGKGKTIKIYTGNLFSSLVKGCIPAKLMGKIVFKRLSKQNFSHSEVELLGIQKNIETENQITAHFRYKRFNNLGGMFESAIGIYALAEIKGKWFINAVSIYDDNDKEISKVNLSEMWYPKKQNSFNGN